MWYLFGAFSAFWLIVFFYMFSLSRRHNELSQEIETLRKSVEQRGAL